VGAWVVSQNRFCVRQQNSFFASVIISWVLQLNPLTVVIVEVVLVSWGCMMKTTPTTTTATTSTTKQMGLTFQPYGTATASCS
jgi:hypothetical protein